MPTVWLMYSKSVLTVWELYGECSPTVLMIYALSPPDVRSQRIKVLLLQDKRFKLGKFYLPPKTVA
jgi:hypothetical protein